MESNQEHLKRLGGNEVERHALRLFEGVMSLDRVARRSTSRALDIVNRMSTKPTTDVFGVSTEILKDSYVDRGDLDSKIAAYLGRDNHIAIRGASKSGKSWLRRN